MSSGKYHDLAIAVALPVVVGVSSYYQLDVSSITLSFVAGGIWLSPDIDLKQSRPSQRWIFLSGLWQLYRSLSGHRGFSHVPIIGTLSRMLYVVLLVAMPLYFSLQAGYIDYTDIPKLNWRSVFLGLEMSALVHLFMDYVLILK